MNPITWFIVGAAIVGLLIFSVFKRLAADRFDALAARLRLKSRVVSRGKLVDGDSRREVLLALTDSSFIYESCDGQSSFDRQWIREVEYENALSTGKSAGMDKVLKLRCFSRTLEFVLSQDAFREWEAILPPFSEVSVAGT